MSLHPFHVSSHPLTTIISSFHFFTLSKVSFTRTLKFANHTPKPPIVYAIEHTCLSLKLEGFTSLRLLTTLSAKSPPPPTQPLTSSIKLPPTTKTPLINNPKKSLSSKKLTPPKNLYSEHLGPYYPYTKTLSQAHTQT